MKKLKNILLWALLFGYIIVALGFAEDNRSKVICNSVEIRFTNGEVNKFLKAGDVKKALEHYKLKMVGNPIDSTQTYLAELIVNKNPAVRMTSAFTTVDGKMIVEVEQRRPILKVINNRMKQYYIDETGRIVPMLGQYAAYTLIANGRIEEPFDIKPMNIFPDNRDSILRPNIIYDLYHVAKYIDENDFWKVQIEQLYVNSRRDIEMVPRVGAHTIILGKSNDLDKKFKKLKALYRAFNEIGWNQYKTINLKYKDQIICTKR